MQSCQHHWLAAPLCVSLLTQAARSAHTHCTWGISAYLACPASQPYPWLWGSLDLTSVRGGRAHLPPEQVKMSDALRSCAQCQYMWLRLSLRGVEFGRGASESEKGGSGEASVVMAGEGCSDNNMQIARTDWCWFQRWCAESWPSGHSGRHRGRCTEARCSVAFPDQLCRQIWLRLQHLSSCCHSFSEFSSPGCSVILWSTQHVRKKFFSFSAFINQSHLLWLTTENIGSMNIQEHQVRGPTKSYTPKIPPWSSLLPKPQLGPCPLLSRWAFPTISLISRKSSWWLLLHWSARSCSFTLWAMSWISFFPLSMWLIHVFVKPKAIYFNGWLCFSREDRIMVTNTRDFFPLLY